MINKRCITVKIADHSCVLRVMTVVVTSSRMRALEETVLPSVAVQVIQQDVPGPWPESALRGYRRGSVVTQPTAHDLGLVHPPLVVTDCAPGTPVVQLHSPQVGPVTTGKTNCATSIVQNHVRLKHKGVTLNPIIFETRGL